MRRTTGVIVTALVAAVLVGCGAVNKGTAFAAEFQRFLDDRDDVVESSISASNNLPFSGTASVSVVLADDLDDEEIVEAVWEITAHEVENQIGYDLQVGVAAENADGGPARTEFAFRVPGPAPDEDRLRDDIADRLEQSRALAALGSGETSVEAFVNLTTVSTQSDAIAFASAVCADDQILGPDEGFSVEGILPTGENTKVVADTLVDCDWLTDGQEVLDALAQVTVVPAYDLKQDRFQSQPRLRVSVPAAEGLDLSAVETTASRLGITLEVVSV